MKTTASAPYSAIIGIGSGAVSILKTHASHANLRTRVGVVSCLGELAEVRGIPASTAAVNGGATVFVTPEMALRGNYEPALIALQQVWNSNIAAHTIAQRVHLEFRFLEGGRTD